MMALLPVVLSMLSNRAGATGAVAAPVTGGGNAMGGLGGLYLRFSTPYFTCGSCTNYTSTNHVGGHVGADIRYYVWRKVFIRPEAHYYRIHNNVEFNGANAARFSVSVGYSFMPGS